MVRLGRLRRNVWDAVINLMGGGRERKVLREIGVVMQWIMRIVGLMCSQKV